MPNAEIMVLLPCSLASLLLFPRRVEEKKRDPENEVAIVSRPLFFLFPGAEKERRETLRMRLPVINCTNLIAGVLGLLGQRVSAQRESGIMDAIYPEKVWSPFQRTCLKLEWN